MAIDWTAARKAWKEIGLNLDTNQAERHWREIEDWEAGLKKRAHASMEARP